MNKTYEEILEEMKTAYFDECSEKIDENPASLKRIEAVAILALFVGLIAYISSQSESVRDRNFRWKEEVMYSTDVPRLTEILDSMEIYRETVDDSIYQLCKDRIYKLTEYED